LSLFKQIEVLIIFQPDLQVHQEKKQIHRESAKEERARGRHVAHRRRRIDFFNASGAQLRSQRGLERLSVSQKGSKSTFEMAQACALCHTARLERYLQQVL